MTLRELLQTVDRRLVYGVLADDIRAKEDSEYARRLSETYDQVIENLLVLQATKEEVNPVVSIVVEAHKEYDDANGEYSLVTVLGRAEDKTLYALDFIDWSELVDLPIENIAGLSDHELAANILWELTFWGFDPEVIKHKRDAIYSYADENEILIHEPDDLTNDVDDRDDEQE